MRAPQFWARPPDRPGAIARMLLPFGRVFAAQTARRVRKGDSFRASVPVICVGNLNVGGTGKTPTVIAVAQRLSARGHHPHIISRGYGGTQTEPLLVDGTRHKPTRVGDEPILLAAFASTWVGADRATAARAAIEAGANCLILDDGFQDPSLAKDLSIVVVDAEHGFGNGRVIPAGPLREPIGVGLARADHLLAIGEDTAQDKFAQTYGLKPDLPVTLAELKPLRTGMDWDGLRVLAFAGIGRPEKFFSMLRKLGADIVRAEALSDHQPLTPALMKRLETQAQVTGVQMVTTEKDAVRLPRDFRQKVLTVPVRLEIDPSSALMRALDDFETGA